MCPTAAAQGKRPEAIALLEQVGKSDVPKQVRAAATYTEILARQSGDLSLLAAQLKDADDPPVHRGDSRLPAFPARKSPSCWWPGWNIFRRRGRPR